MYVIIAKTTDDKTLYYGTFTTRKRAESYAMALPMSEGAAPALRRIKSWEIQPIIRPHDRSV